jgi:hypothetical protein
MGYYNTENHSFAFIDDRQWLQDKAFPSKPLGFFHATQQSPNFQCYLNPTAYLKMSNQP